MWEFQLPFDVFLFLGAKRDSYVLPRQNYLSVTFVSSSPQ